MASKIRSVTICSSSRFYETAEAMAARLEQQGLKVFTPSFEHDETRVTVDLDTKVQLTREFLEKVRAADAIYVIAGDGYIGRSVALEVGFATALGKPVYLSEEASEGAIQALTTEVIPPESFRPAVLLTAGSPASRAA